jgi:hypothetical protein
MKFAITLLALAATALAQSTAVTETAPSQTPTAETTCLSKCAPGDVNCQAVCVGVPNPNAQQMNQTTECVAQCDQGDGSAAATQKYTACRNNCISSYILIGTTAHTPATTASATSAPNVNTINTSTLTGSALSAASSSIGTLPQVLDLDLVPELELEFESGY